MPTSPEELRVILLDSDPPPKMGVEAWTSAEDQERICLEFGRRSPAAVIIVNGHKLGVLWPEQVRNLSVLLNRE